MDISWSIGTSGTETYFEPCQKDIIIDIWQGSKYEVVIDVLFDLKSDTSRLHRELNDTPIYIDANSHHSSNVNHQTT